MIDINKLLSISPGQAQTATPPKPSNLGVFSPSVPINTFSPAPIEKPTLTPNAPSIANTTPATSTGVPVFSNAYNDFTTKLHASIDAYHNPNASFTESLGKNVQTLVSGIGLATSPISLGLDSATKVGGLPGLAARGAVGVMDTGGRVSGKLASLGLNAIPDAIMSQQTKNNLDLAVRDVGNLIFQAFLGEKLFKLGGKNIPKEVVDEVHSDLVKNVEDIAKGREITTPEEAKSIAVEAAKKTTDKIGETMKLLSERTATATEPRSMPAPSDVFQGDNFTMKSGSTPEELKLAEVTQKYQKALEKYNANPTPELLNKTIKARGILADAKNAMEPTVKMPTESVQPTSPTERVNASPRVGLATKPTVAGESFVSKAATDMTTKLKEQGLIPQNFEDLPQAERITFADQIKKTSELLQSDMPKVRRIISGEEPMPSDIKVAALLEGARRMAIENKDFELSHMLSNSPLMKETSIHAQETSAMRILQPDSMISKMDEIKKAREKNIEKSAGKNAKKKIVEEGKKALKKTSIKPKTWADFIESIKCK